MDIINTPETINDTVIDFCKTIVMDSVPEYVLVHPESWCKENECYANVEQKIKNSGGMRQLGWRIQISKGIMIEAVHHAIWISETGEKIDITPQPYSAKNIVFLSDDSTKFDKYRIGEKYQALCKCSLINKYVYLCNLESVKYKNKTRLEQQPNIPQELLDKQAKLLAKIAETHKLYRRKRG